MRSIIGAVARYLASKPLLAAFLTIGAADAARALVVGGIA